MQTTDILIIGSGIAGLSTAIKIAEKRPDLRIIILTKSDEGESNTNYAQGGVAAVWDDFEDSYEKHINDTIDAGDGLGDYEVIRTVVEEGPERIKELIQWGMEFDRKSNTHYDLAREGGHSSKRILHSGDFTGRAMQEALIKKANELSNIEIFEHYFVVDLITQHHLGYHITRVTPGIECYGAYVLDKDTGTIHTFLSKFCVLASGGAGQVYSTTTNPLVATGDGVAMVYRAKGRVANMEFIQFHPTAFHDPGGPNPAFLISEAVRGHGAILKSRDGELFMEKYDTRKSLAPRDIVARAIDREMKLRGDEFVLLDCSPIPRKDFTTHFPIISAFCEEKGVDPFTDGIPVKPACHYLCGGVVADLHGKSSIANLYAVGECSFSGLHGANRLASNSLLEALVFAHRVAESILAEVDKKFINEGIPPWYAKGTTEPDEMVLITQSIKELQEIMSNYVGIVRTPVRLKRALDRLKLLYTETEKIYQSTIISPQLCELRNMISVGYLITRSAELRKESRGLHYNLDHLEKLAKTQDTFL